jgi:hypothetical protein
LEYYVSTNRSYIRKKFYRLLFRDKKIPKQVF